MATHQKIRWGIISTADIGMKKVIPGIMKSAHSEVVAIASRDLPRAQAAARQLGIAKAYGSYEELLADPDVDAVYNPLPNHLHVPLTVMAAKAGKHVLCEKPIGLNAADAEALRACPPGRIVAEAFMIRYHPQWLRARNIVRSGELGRVTAISASFSYFLDDPHNVRNKADIGGGGILDIGCYPVTAARFLFEAEPHRVVSLVERHPEFKTDIQASVLADFGSGRQLNFMVSTQLAPYQKIQVMGDKKRLEILIPFNAPPDAATQLIIDDGEALDGTAARRETIPASDQYTDQAEAFALAALGGTPLPYGIEDSIQSMRILDAIFKSERSGLWEKITA